MNAITKTLLGSLAVVALGGAAWAALREGRVDVARPDLDLVAVARRDLGTVVKATGVVRPRIGAEVRVGSRVSGVVGRLHVQVGDAVEAGELLAELDATELIARRDEAAAALVAARASLDFAAAELTRRRALQAAGVAAAAELDSAERAAALAAAEVDARRATLAVATTQLGYAAIRAPIEGVVASVSTQEGETVAASFATPTFVTLLDLARLEVWAYVDETDVGRVESGQTARFTVDTYGDEEFAGRVTAIYPQAEIRDNVVNYVAVVSFEPPAERALRPEMTATVRIALETRAGVLALPLRAVRWDGGRPFVAVPSPAGGGRGYERRAITTGSRDESYWEITGGVEEGETVLVGDLEPSTEE